MEKRNNKGRYAAKAGPKPLWIVIAVLCALLLIGLIVYFASTDQDTPVPEQTLPHAEIAPSEPSLPAESQDTIPTDPVAPETEPVETEHTEPTEAEPTETTAPKVTVPATKPTEPAAPKEPDRIPVTFPYVIPGTDLVVQYINSYSGVFMEDGSDHPVEDISAMVIVNLGQTQVEYAKITISCNETLLTYNLSGMPAGSTIVVQESNATPYSDGEYYNCSCELAELDAFEMSEDQVRVEENEDGSLLVTNLTDEAIPTIRIFYKFYMFDEDVYVCGITYTAKIQDLEGNASCVVTPSHYVPGSSRIVMVRTYDVEN